MWFDREPAVLYNANVGSRVAVLFISAAIADAPAWKNREDGAMARTENGNVSGRLRLWRPLFCAVNC